MVNSALSVLLLLFLQFTSVVIVAENGASSPSPDADSKTESRKRFYSSWATAVKRCLTRNVTAIKLSVYLTCVIGYAAYFAYALYYQFGEEQSIRLLWVTMTVVVCFLICIVQDHFGSQIYEHLIEPIVDFIIKHWRVFKM